MARMRSPTNTASGARWGGRTIERTSHCSAGNSDIVIFPTARTGPARMSDGRPQNIVGAAKTSADILFRHLRYAYRRTTPPQTAYPAGDRASWLEPWKTNLRPSRSSSRKALPEAPTIVARRIGRHSSFSKRHIDWIRPDLGYRNTRNGRTSVRDIDGIIRAKAHCQTMAGKARPARCRTAAQD